MDNLYIQKGTVSFYERNETHIEAIISSHLLVWKIEDFNNDYLDFVMTKLREAANG